MTAWRTNHCGYDWTRTHPPPPQKKKISPSLSRDLCACIAVWAHGHQTTPHMRQSASLEPGRQRRSDANTHTHMHTHTHINTHTHTHAHTQALFAFCGLSSLYMTFTTVTILVVARACELRSHANGGMQRQLGVVGVWGLNKAVLVLILNVGKNNPHKQAAERT